MFPNRWIALLLTILVEVTKAASQNLCRPSPCGINSVCLVTAKHATCSCDGRVGNPFVECGSSFARRFPSRECANNSKCTQYETCINNICQDLCPGSCGINARCQAANHTSICSCPPGYTGDAFTECVPKDAHLLLPDATICGISGRFEEFPWMALIIYENVPGSDTDFYFCGASLISKRYVLTSAGCMEKSAEKQEIQEVRLGEYNLDTDPDCLRSSLSGVYCAPSPVKVQVEKIIVHEDYSFFDENQYHDIALLRLREEVDFTETVRPICLPYMPEERNRAYFGRRLTVAGWGETEAEQRSPVKRTCK